MAPKTPPGETRAQIFRFVEGELLKGQPPTVREVQRAFKFRSVQTAREHLEALVAAGKLTKQSGKARGYRLPRRFGSGSLTFVPILGRVQAGVLTAAIEDPVGHLAVEGHGSSGELFALSVRGESMIGAGILPGDIAIVRRQSTAGGGDIVVALIGDEATVKRLRIHKGRIELHPENPSFAPIIPGEKDEVILLGKVVEVRRFLEGAPEADD